MARFEDIIPDIRKGRKFRKASWKAGKYIYFERDGPNWGDVLTDQDGLSDTYFAFEPHWIIDEDNDWEIVPEPVRVADYLQPDPFSMTVSGKCLRWVSKTYPIGQQPEGSVMVPGSEKLLDE